MPRFAPIALAEGVKPFAQDVATAATTPYAEHVANQEAQRAVKELTPTYGPDAAQEYAGRVKQDLLNQHLNTAGIDQSTPTSTVARKVIGNAAQTAGNIIFADQIAKGTIPGLTNPADTLTTQAIKSGTLNAASNIAGVAGSDNPNALDYLKAGGTGFVQGAAFPVAEAIAPKLVSATTKTVANTTPKAVIHQNLLNNNPQYAQLQDALERSSTAANNLSKSGGSKVAINQHLKNIKDIQGQMTKMRQDFGQSGSINPNGEPIGATPANEPLPENIAASKGEVGKVSSANITSSSNASIPAPLKPRLISDPQLKQIEAARKSVVNTAADEIMAKNPTSLKGEVLKNGGISSTAYETYPKGIIRKAGVSADKMAQVLGYKSENDLMDTLNNEQKPITRAQAKEQAQQQIESGQHPYSADYKQMTDALNQRQAELGLYPKDATRTTTKPASMTPAELASLAATPEGRASLGNRIRQINPKKAVRNADAERTVLGGLQSGTNTDEILSQYQKDTGVSLQKAVSDVNRIAKESQINLNLGKNPELGKVSVPTVGKGDSGQAKLNADYVIQHEQSIGQKALTSYNALSANDKVLLKDIELHPVSEVAAKANDPAAFKQAEADIRHYYDTRHAYDNYLGLDVGYRTNYLRQLFDKVEQNDESLPTRASGGTKNPSYKLHRTNETLGTEVGTALQKDIAGSSFNHAKLTYEQGLRQAFPSKIEAGSIVKTPEDGTFEQILSPYGKDLVAPADIARQINSRTWRPTDSKALNVYDNINHGLKYTKLAGGLFHAFTEAGNFVGQQLGSGNLFKHPAATGRLVKVFFSEKTMGKEMSRLAADGTLDKAHLSGLTLRPDEILADASVKLGGKISKYTGIQALHDATFQREIPYAKAKIFEQKTQGLDVNNPADLAKMRSISREINQAFGGINREIQGIKPGTFKWLQRGLLATDFTEGKIHTLFDAVASGGEAGKLARQVVIGKAIVFGVMATAGAAMGGEYQGQNNKQIAKNAAGNLLDPTFEMGGYKVGLPKTQISEFIDPLKPTIQGVNGKRDLSGVQHYITARTAALPSELNQLATNKDFYGQPIYGKNTKKNGGGNIGPVQTAINIGNTVLPIPFGQSTKAALGKQSVPASVANVAGFNVKPNAANTVSFGGVSTTLTDPQRRTYQTQLSNTQKAITSQLTNSTQFKGLSPNDQAQALTNLKTAITSAVGRQFSSANNLGPFAPSYTGPQSVVTAKEKSIIGGQINPLNFIPKSAGGVVAKTPKVKKAVAAKTVKKTTKKATTSRSTKVAGSAPKATLASYIKVAKAANAAIKPPKVPTAPKFKVGSSKPPSFKQTSLKKFAVSKPTVSRKKQLA